MNRLSLPRKRPIGVKFRSVQANPLKYELESFAWQSPAMHLRRVPLDQCLLVSEVRVKMWWYVIVKVHHDVNAVEFADRRH